MPFHPGSADRPSPVQHREGVPAEGDAIGEIYHGTTITPLFASGGAQSAPGRPTLTARDPFSDSDDHRITKMAFLPWPGLVLE